MAERELLAAYVSGLNACDYCFGVHRVTAASLGVREDTLTALLDDVDSADVDERMRPLLRYAGKLTASSLPGHPCRRSSGARRRVGRASSA